MKALIVQSLRAAHLLDRLQPLVLLLARLYVANVFFSSGLVKLANWGNTVALFRDEYHVPVLPPPLAAALATFGELVFPALLVIGLASRLSAMGLFVVNAVAVLSYPQLFGLVCPAGIHAHAYWASILLVLIVFGPGQLSIDAWILRKNGFWQAAPRHSRVG